MKEFKRIKTNTNVYPERLLLLAGAGQNVGKTTFACRLIQHLKSLHQKVYALKISPHFHKENPPKTIFANEQYILSLEDNKNTGKDSSRMLAIGADEAFFLQVNDEHLMEAFEYTMSFIPPNVFVVIESGGLRELLKPSLFFFIKKSNSKEIKEKAKKNMVLADRIIEFDGHDFNFQIKNIRIINGLIILND